MNSSKTLGALYLALACAAITFSLCMGVQGQTVDFVYDFHNSGNQTSGVTMIQGTDGNLYGAANGGAHGQGEIFRMTPSGDLTTIYRFCKKSNCPDGSIPENVVLGSDGNIYGVTVGGGSDVGFTLGSGTVFKITPGGELTTLYTFCPIAGCADGRAPRGISLASDGNFCGTTQVGGKFSQGTIFSLSPTGTFKLLHTFCSQSNCGDGGDPQSPPTQGIDGNFYGTAYSGGTHNGGVIYQITAAGVYKVLYNFCSYQTSCPTGADPMGALTQDAAGNFFGTTAFGGDTRNDGVVFEFTAKNQYKILHTLQGYDGTVPQSQLALASNGSLYGVTQGGGGPAEGNIYKVTSAGVVQVVLRIPVLQRRLRSCLQPFSEHQWSSLWNHELRHQALVATGRSSASPTTWALWLKPYPRQAKSGNRSSVLGNGLTGSTSVKFNGKAAAFTVVSDTEITATVPSGATTGKVSVVTPSGTLNSNPQFVVTK